MDAPGKKVILHLVCFKADKAHELAIIYNLKMKCCINIIHSHDCV